jgi:hypothetical protein
VVIVYHVVLRGGPPLAGDDARVRVLDEPTVDTRVVMTTADGAEAVFRITGDYELVDGRERRVYAYIGPVDGA